MIYLIWMLTLWPYTADGLIFVGHQFSWFPWRVRYTNMNIHELAISCMSYERKCYSMTTNFEPNECFFFQSAKIGTHENKAIHSSRNISIF